MIPKILMPMNLQFFAEDKPQGDPKNPVDPPKPKDGDPVDPLEDKKQGEPADPDPDGKHVYTDEQVNEIVKKRLARAEKEKQAAVDEAAKLAKMNADQKKDYELQKAQKERDELKSQLATYEMGKQARSMFEDAKLSVTEDDLKQCCNA
ncbi:phage protein [Lacticaseibacillus paracasei subsp. paracasei Lpp126]|uniref:Phage protein n=1 Tax=Lacticaseibacillus paracasei subsp. paracasei Lpp126 TaxID=1256206 RepID=S2RPY9_LACPA|nr:phage protein [Lacticaseibacillus paracasei subsp. paracasei Lpp126]